MDIPEALSKISKALGVLAYQTRAENLGGLFSKNRLIEDLLLPVFRIVLKAPQLRNLNKAGVNFPYIDLADELSRIAVQVTTERTAAKVTDNLCPRNCAPAEHDCLVKQTRCSVGSRPVSIPCSYS